MTAQILRVFDHCTNTRQVAEQKYELAKQQVRQLILGGPLWCPENQEKFLASMQRQEEAREWCLKALGA